MKAVWVVAGREFRAMVESRAYLVGSAVGLAAILGLSLLPTLLRPERPPQPVEVVVVDPTGATLVAMREAARAMGPGRGAPAFAARAWEAAFAGHEAPSLQELRRRAGQGAIQVYVWVNRRPDGELEWRVGGRLVPAAVVGAVQAVAARVAVADRAERLGLSPQALALLEAPAALVLERVRPGGEVEMDGPAAPATVEGGSGGDAAEEVSRALSFALMFILYLSLIFHGAAVSNGVSAEKGSRVVEMLLVAARPADLLLGKLVGIGAASLAQYVLWGGAGALAFPVQRGWLNARLSQMLGTPVVLAGVPWWMGAYLALFFLLAFFAFGALFAASGCLASRPEESSQTVWPPVVLIVTAYLLASFALADPRSRVAVVGSLLPYVGPMVMYTRIALSSAPPGEIVACVAVSAATALASVGLAARVYQRTLLSTRRTGWLGVWRAGAQLAR